MWIPAQWTVMTIPATASVPVRATPEEVFAVLSDPARFHEWQAGMEPARTDAGPIGVGSRLRSRRRVAGMRMGFTSEIVTWEPPARMVFRSVRTPLAVEGTYLVEPSDDGSRVTAHMRIGAPSFGPFRLGDRAGEVIAHQLERDLSAFAALFDRPTEQA